MYAQSEDPAVYTCVFAIFLGRLPLFARMNTNWAEFLMARDAVVSKIFSPFPPCFLRRLNIDVVQCPWLAFGVTHVP